MSNGKYGSNRFSCSYRHGMFLGYSNGTGSGLFFR
jgi:hypothetical protein